MIAFENLLLFTRTDYYCILVLPSSSFNIFALKFMFIMKLVTLCWSEWKQHNNVTNLQDLALKHCVWRKDDYKFTIEAPLKVQDFSTW